jgi:DNA polymerase-3 subunit delta
MLTIVMLPRLDKATRASAWFSALDGYGVTLAVEPVERQALPLWIAQRLSAQGQRVRGGEEGQRTLQFFADRVEGNLLAAHQEIQKLGLLYPAGELGFEQIESAVLNVARFDVFGRRRIVCASWRYCLRRECFASGLECGHGGCVLGGSRKVTSGVTRSCGYFW